MVAVGFLQLLGVIEQFMLKIFWQDNRSPHHWPCQTSAAYFIAASFYLFFGIT
jgi:hypothetical protein